MVERHREGRRAAARPLLAYAPEFLEPVSSFHAFQDDEEREHQRRREELLRRKRALLEAEKNQRIDPKADMQGRMNALREALQANLDAKPNREPAALETSGAAAKPESQPVKLPRRRRRWGLLAGFTLLGGIIATTYAFLVPPQYAATASLQVFPPERRSEIASNIVLEHAAQLARVEQAADLGAPLFLEELRLRLSRLLPKNQQPEVPKSGAELLRQRLDFTQALDSGTVTVEATADKPATAVLFANAVVQAFRGHLQGGASLNGLEGDLPAQDEPASVNSTATVRIIAPAIAEPNPRSLAPQWIIALGFAAGFLLGLFSMALAERKLRSPSKTEAEPEEVLEPYGETRLAAVIREANARWEAENDRISRPKENAALGRVIDDIRSSHIARS